MNVEPLDIASLFGYVTKFYEARARSDDKLAMAYAEAVMIAFRTSITDDAIFHTLVSTSRGLWRLKAAELDGYITRAVINSMVSAIMKDRTILSTVVRENLNADFQPAIVPKQIVSHRGSLSLLVVPLKESPK